MALIQTSEMISNIKGSIGGTTFSMIRAGLIAKKRLVGKRILNSKQSAAINYSLLSTYAWNQLTNTQKNDFNSYALANSSTDRFGVTKLLTGYNWFKLLNQNSLFFTGSNITAPPAHSVPLPPPTFTVSPESDGIYITFSTPIDTANYYWMCYTTGPIRGNATLQRGAYRLTDVRALSLTGTFNIVSKWNDAHGLVYSSLITSAKFNINVMFYPIKKTSLVNGTAQTGIGSTS